ncbi:MAG: 3-phosphoserine/phosphohydroxythreonine transaminase [Pyrinomonadaceae bacterium]
MTQTIYNFSAGPAVLPRPVLERARDEMLSVSSSGMSVMELSHRSKQFETILNAAEEGLRELLDVPANYHILFLQGGASLQFNMIPMNFLAEGKTADYIVTGTWGAKALKEATRCGNANVIYDGAGNGFTDIPQEAEIDLNPDAGYLHYTSNETIHGVEFDYEIEADGVQVICDASSNILSKPLDIKKYACIYAGSQKNIGPSGVTVVIIHDDMTRRIPKNQHSMLDYRLFAENRSMLNTPNTWGIYIISLVVDWLRDQGGTPAMKLRNRDKAHLLYDAIDASGGYYAGHAKLRARSLMNVTFRLPSPDLDEKFCSEASALGLDGLRGHRSVGGIRASIYNAFPRAGVEALVDLMNDFRRGNS